MKNIEDLSRTQIEYLIDEWILSKRNREIMKSRLIDGLTYEQISEKFSLSVTQIKNIVYYCKNYLEEKSKSAS